MSWYRSSITSSAWMTCSAMCRSPSRNAWVPAVMASVVRAPSRIRSVRTSSSSSWSVFLASSGSTTGSPFMCAIMTISRRGCRPARAALACSLPVVHPEGPWRGHRARERGSATGWTSRVHRDVTSGTVPIQTASLPCSPMNEIGTSIDGSTDRSTPMIRSRARWGIALVLVLGLVAAACGSDTKTGSTSGGSTSATTKPTKQLAATTLAGSGSTFQQAFNEAVIAQFKTVQPAVTVTYAGGGSGQGQLDLQNNTKQWAGSDSTIKPEDMSKYKGTVLYFPTVAAPITISYNLSGVSKLNLSPDTVANIFEGKITKWDDAAIKSDNPSATLPSTAIVVAHRADASGTTANFTKYLTLAAPTAWTLGTDKTVAWPAGQQAGNANGGVAQIVKSTSGAVGYVDYSD